MPMSDDLAGVALNTTQKSMEIAAELIKMLAPALKKGVEMLLTHDISGAISKNQLFVQASNANSSILSNSNFLASDRDVIAAKAAQYKIPVSFVGNGEKVTMSYLDRDKAEVNQILQEIMQERMKEAPQSVKAFPVSEPNVNALKSCFEENGLECNFVKGANGKIYCTYPADSAEKVAILKQEFIAMRDNVDHSVKADLSGRAASITDLQSGQSVTFDKNAMSKDRVVAELKDKMGYTSTQAELAANKICDDLQLDPQKYFRSASQLDNIDRLKVNIKYSSDSILLKDTTFSSLSFKGSPTHIFVTHGDNTIALTPSKMTETEMKNSCMTHLEMSEEQAAETVNKAVRIDTQLNSKIKETAIFRETGEAQTVTIDRTSNSSFSVLVGTKKREYNFNDKSIADKMSKDYGITTAKAQTIIDKAQKQSTFQNNLSRIAQSAKEKNSKIAKELKEKVGKTTGVRK